MVEILIRIGLRKELRRARRAKDEERVDLITQALEDDDVFDLTVEGVYDMYEYDEDVKEDFGDFLKRFVQWFKDNREEILETIQMIIQILALFALGEDDEE